MSVLKKEEIIQYWIDSALDDYKTMKHLFDSEDYLWCLFMCHIIVEKLLKALYVKNIETIPPKTHDLLFLAKKIQLPLDTSMADFFDLLTTFNINTRYPDYKREFHKKCTREYTQNIIEKVEDVIEWLKRLIQE